MPRRFQTGSGGIVFHVMNRGARRSRLFFDDDDYRCFLRAMVDALTHIDMRILCYALMPNHWHLVLWPVADRDLSAFMERMTRLHAQRWHLAHNSVGTGAVYQGRFRALAVQTSDYFLTVCRYVERNPLRAGLVSRASEWEWSSAWPGALVDDGRPPLATWPVARPDDWALRLNGDEPPDADDVLREAIRRSSPFGGREWSNEVGARLHLTGKQRGRGRPRRDDVAEIEIRPGRNSLGDGADAGAETGGAGNRW